VRVLVATLLVLPLAATGWLAVQVVALRESRSAQRETIAALAADVDRLEKSPPTPQAPAPPIEFPVAHAGTEDTARRLESLERRVETLQETVDAVLDAVSRRGLLSPGSLVVDDAEKAAQLLDLDAGQLSALDRIVAESAAELRRLYETANADGWTWNAVADRRVAVSTGGDDHAPTTESDVAALRRFEETTVPGSTETYAEARRRLVRDGLERVGSILRPGQREILERARAQGLVDRRPGAASSAAPELRPQDSEPLGGSRGGTRPR
jgi:hypothetical protein